MPLLSEKGDDMEVVSGLGTRKQVPEPHLTRRRVSSDLWETNLYDPGGLRAPNCLAPLPKMSPCSPTLAEGSERTWKLLALPTEGPAQSAPGAGTSGGLPVDGTQGLFPQQSGSQRRACEVPCPCGPVGWVGLGVGGSSAYNPPLIPAPSPQQHPP